MSQFPMTEAMIRDRAEEVGSVLASVISQYSLDRGFAGARRWAIVGGVVRDHLLSENPAQIPVPLLSWPDLDIAVNVGSTTVETDLLGITHAAVNTFGGRKLVSDVLGTIDMWLWESANPEGVHEEWEGLLARCDFGVNAVGYAWPEGRVVMHRRWLEDVCKPGPIQIENLTPGPVRAIHVVRGIALYVKLSASSKRKVVLGPRFLDDVKWFGVEAERGEVRTAWRYLVDKCGSGRWPNSVKEALGKELRRITVDNELATSAPAGRLLRFLAAP